MVFKKRGKNKKRKNKSPAPQGEVFRVRLPRGTEIMGVLEQRLGANHMLIKCLDGKSRTCRVPGRLRRRLWLRPGNIVIVEPWEIGGETKGDVIWKYNPAEVEWLKRKGFLKTVEAEF